MKESPVTEGKHTPGSGKTTLADDLRAARALIDTPEKWRAHHGGRMTAAMRGALRGAAGRAFAIRNENMRAAVDASRNGATTLEEWQAHPTTTHADIMALFDRAINAADATGAS